MKRSTEAERPLRYWNQETQSNTGMLKYRTDMMNAGMPMPVASASMPMPSYGKEMVCNKEDALFSIASQHGIFMITPSPFPMNSKLNTW
jgi:hypothetical protein